MVARFLCEVQQYIFSENLADYCVDIIFTLMKCHVALNFLLYSFSINDFIAHRRALF